MGIGLAICRRIIEIPKGKVEGGHDPECGAPVAVFLDPVPAQTGTREI